MLELIGFAASNYYNKVKLALLEKGIAFQEQHAYPSASDAFLADSPMGKVPVLRTHDGVFSESQAIVEYLEEAFPQRPLYPIDALQRAKCRELIQIMELYLELPVRRLYPAAFFGGSASEALKQNVRADLARGLRALGRLARFEPFIAGAQLTLADCAAIVHLPLASGTCKAIYGSDQLESLSGLSDYVRMMTQRPHVRRVNDDRKQGIEAFVAYRAKLQSAPGSAAAAGAN